MLSHIVGFFGTIFTWFFCLTFGPCAIGFGIVTLYYMIRYGECWHFNVAYSGQLKPGFADYAFVVVVSIGAVVTGYSLICLPFK